MCGQWAKLFWYQLFSFKNAICEERILMCGPVGQTLLRATFFPQKRLPYIYSTPGGLSKRMLSMKFCLVSKMLEYLTLSMWASGSLGQVALSSVKNYAVFLEDNEVTVIIATFPPIIGSNK